TRAFWPSRRPGRTSSISSSAASWASPTSTRWPPGRTRSSCTGAPARCRRCRGHGGRGGAGHTRARAVARCGECRANRRLAPIGSPGRGGGEGGVVTEPRRLLGWLLLVVLLATGCVGFARGDYWAGISTGDLGPCPSFDFDINIDDDKVG